MKYDRREIMTIAHYIRKEAGVSMSEALRWVWAHMKETRIERIKTEIDRIETESFMLAMKDRWSDDDYRQNYQWRQELEALNAQLIAA